MPFGPFENFGDCLNNPAMTEKYPDKATRERICGALQKDLGGGSEEERLKRAELSLGIFDFIASVEVLDAENHFAKIWVIDNTVNLNKWGVTKPAIQDGLESLKGMPLLGPPSSGHGPDSSPTAIDRFEKAHTIGEFVETNVNGSAWGVAKITDEEAWEAIKTGKWKYVSPRVVPTRSVKREDGVDILERFNFEHVAFVDSPAIFWIWFKELRLKKI